MLKIIILINLFLVNCQAQIREYIFFETPPGLTLNLSDKHRGYFSVDKKIYIEDEIGEFLKIQRKKITPICDMLYGYREWNETEIKEAIKDIKLKLAVKKYYNNTIPRLIAGCWVFYQTNDKQVDKDFRKLSQLYPKIKKDCYSVGFIQPYLMHNFLNCSNLTVVDISWRIIDLHYQIINQFKDVEYDDEDDLAENISKLEVSWSANLYDLPVEKTNEVSVGKFCSEEQINVCKNAILNFQNNLYSLNSINFQITRLHEGVFHISNDSTLFFYLSNAIDREYTSKIQFDELLDSVFSKLEFGKFAVFIYHVGGAKGFGVYELHRTNAGEKKVITRCKDVYTPPLILKIQKPIITHFEQVSSTRGKIEACSELLFE
jgi:hypothetical protein